MTPAEMLSEMKLTLLHSVNMLCTRSIIAIMLIMYYYVLESGILFLLCTVSFFYLFFAENSKLFTPIATEKLNCTIVFIQSISLHQKQQWHPIRIIITVIHALYRHFNVKNAICTMASKTKNASARNFLKNVVSQSCFVNERQSTFIIVMIIVEAEGSRSGVAVHLWKNLHFQRMSWCYQILFQTRRGNIVGRVFMIWQGVFPSMELEDQDNDVFTMTIVRRQVS
jgi:hypothetical protein